MIIFGNKQQNYKIPTENFGFVEKTWENLGKHQKDCQNAQRGRPCDPQSLGFQALGRGLMLVVNSNVDFASQGHGSRFSRVWCFQRGNFWVFSFRCLTCKMQEARETNMFFKKEKVFVLSYYLGWRWVSYIILCHACSMKSKICIWFRCLFLNPRCWGSSIALASYLRFVLGAQRNHLLLRLSKRGEEDIAEACKVARRIEKVGYLTSFQSFPSPKKQKTC